VASGRAVASVRVAPFGCGDDEKGYPPVFLSDVNWRVRNCSITEFVLSPVRLSRDSFNSVSHFDAALRTFY